MTPQDETATPASERCETPGCGHPLSEHTGEYGSCEHIEPGRDFCGFSFCQKFKPAPPAPSHEAAGTVYEDPKAVAVISGLTSEIAALRAEVERLNPLGVAKREVKLREEINASLDCWTKAEARVAELESLAAFGKAIIESYFNDGDFGDLDGGDVQDKAVELGILVHPEVAHDPDDCEACSEEPRSCYVLSAAALAAPPAPSHEAGTLTREEFERSVGAVSDPGWPLASSYRDVLLAHDAALREEVERLAQQTRQMSDEWLRVDELRQFYLTKYDEQLARADKAEARVKEAEGVALAAAQVITNLHARVAALEGALREIAGWKRCGASDHFHVGHRCPSTIAVAALAAQKGETR